MSEACDHKRSIPSPTKYHVPDPHATAPENKWRMYRRQCLDCGEWFLKNEKEKS